MARILILILWVVLSACFQAPVDNTSASENTDPKPSPTPGISIDVTSLRPANDVEIATAKAIEDRKRRELTLVPSEFKNVDFKNYVYPSFLRGGSFKLKNGEIREEYRLGAWYSTYGATAYADLTGDGLPEAIVELFEAEVGGSTYGTFSYYVFSKKGSKIGLLWKFHTGSEASCGHKSIAIENGKIVLEVFGICSLRNMSSENYDTDVNAKNYTKLVIGWSNGQFKTESREILPYPKNDISVDLYKRTFKAALEEQLNQ